MSVPVNLSRDGLHTSWGFTLRGGKDLNEAFTIKKVAFGSPAAEAQLKNGDLVVKINGVDTHRLTHQKAHDLIKNAGSTISLLINRAGRNAGASNPPPSTTSSQADANQPKVVSMAPGTKISEVMAKPVQMLPITIFPVASGPPAAAAVAPAPRPAPVNMSRERAAVITQPYRTTQLVFPGAKVARDVPVPTQSYLGMQNQMGAMGQPAATASNVTVIPQNAPEVVLKQKGVRVFHPTHGWRDKQELEAAAALLQQNSANLAPAQGSTAPATKPEVVIKQFNSPLGLYSNESIQEAMALQTGAVPLPKAAKMLDLKASETYRALLDEEFRPATAKEFKPPTPAAKVAAPGPHYKVAQGQHQRIAQSGSFYKIAQDVLGETDF